MFKFKNDQIALLRLYANHNTDVMNNYDFPFCFHVLLVEMLAKGFFDWCKNIWFHRINVSIDISQIILPKIKYNVLQYVCFANWFELLNMNFQFLTL